MYGSTRIKRVTDPLDDKVKARIVGWNRTVPGYVSSGSEHSAQANDDLTSPSLSDLFFGFPVDDDGESLPESNDSDSECDLSMSDSSFGGAVDLIKPILLDQSDEFKRVLKAHVLKAVQRFSCVKSDIQVMRRNVMAVLRDYGYNAAICKTKWERSGGITSGNYEFIDVLKESSTRYFIDLDFASEFEIARPTNSYERLLQCLPRVFVGKSEDLKPILKSMSDAAKRSLKSKDLHLPPWRKHRFMQNKWFGSFRRTTNLFPASFSSPSQVNQIPAIKCRAVGFDAAVNGGHLSITAIARTR